jgi:hypothetical protein
VLPAPVDPQRRLLADEDPDGGGGDAGALQIGDRGVGGLGGGEDAHQVVGRVAEQPALRASPGGGGGSVGGLVRHEGRGYRRGARTVAGRTIAA